MTDLLAFRGVLKSHTGWVTSIATTSTRSDMILSGSRDKTVIQWDLSQGSVEDGEYGRAFRAMKGHSHFVEDVVISRDGHFALSAAWDGEIRLWDLSNGTTHRRFVGHEKDVLSVAFSADNRQIVSGSRDKTIRLWNTLGECKYTIEDGGHTDWVSCVQFSPSTNNPVIVSAGWDKVVKVWTLREEFKLSKNLVGHTGYINSVAVSPDGSLCASGGKDGTAMLWDLNEGKHLYSLDAGDVINTLVFSPNRYWLCAGTLSGIKIWDLESKIVLAEIHKDYPGFVTKHPSQTIGCLSLAWSSDGSTLFAGYTDNLIRVWVLK